MEPWINGLMDCSIPENERIPHPGPLPYGRGEGKCRQSHRKGGFIGGRELPKLTVWRCGDGLGAPGFGIPSDFGIRNSVLRRASFTWYRPMHERWRLSDNPSTR